MAQRVDVVCRHSSTALANAMEHQSLFLMPRVAGDRARAAGCVKARTLAQDVDHQRGRRAGAAVGCCSSGRPTSTLHAKGTLEPVDRRDVFAGIDGVVDEVPVQARRRWSTRATSCWRKLRNTDVERSADGRRRPAAHRPGAHRLACSGRCWTSGKLPPEENEPAYGELAEAAGEAGQPRSASGASTQQKIDGLRSAARSTARSSPGTWSNRLIHRPVQRGQMLLRVADPERALAAGTPHARGPHGPHRPGPAETRRARHTAGDLHPGHRAGHEAPRRRSRRSAQSAEVHGEEGNTVLIKVAINKADVTDDLRPGATVTAKIHCGRRSLGYVWFHDLMAFIQSRILFRLL